MVSTYEVPLAAGQAPALVEAAALDVVEETELVAEVTDALPDAEEDDTLLDAEEDETPEFDPPPATLTPET